MKKGFTRNNEAVGMSTYVATCFDCGLGPSEAWGPVEKIGDMIMINQSVRRVLKFDNVHDNLHFPSYRPVAHKDNSIK